MKKGFTIIELMAVVAIIGILLGVIVTASSNSIKLSRTQRTKALCKCVKQGIDNYRAQKDEWPGGFIDENGVMIRSNSDGYNNQTVAERCNLEGDEVRRVVRALVDESVKRHNPMLDVSALFVSDQSGEANTRHIGYDFMEAVKGTKRHPRKMSIDQMHFGYPETDHGWFRRFSIVFFNTAQEMEVGTL